MCAYDGIKRKRKAKRKEAKEKIKEKEKQKSFQEKKYFIPKREVFLLTERGVYGDYSKAR